MDGKYGFIPLVDEETGEEYEFEVLDMLNYEGHVYYVLMNADIPTDEVVILEAVIDEDDEDEEENFLPVEDEDLLETLFNMFQEKQED